MAVFLNTHLQMWKRQLDVPLIAAALLLFDCLFCLKDLIAMKAFLSPYCQNFFFSIEI